MCCSLHLCSVLQLYPCCNLLGLGMAVIFHRLLLFRTKSHKLSSPSLTFLLVHCAVLFQAPLGSTPVGSTALEEMGARWLKTTEEKQQEERIVKYSAALDWCAATQSQMHKEKTPTDLNCCCRGQKHFQRVLNGLCMTNRARCVWHILLSSLPQALRDVINLTWMMPLHQRCVCHLAQEQRRKCWCVWGKYWGVRSEKLWGKESDSYTSNQRSSSLSFLGPPGLRR